jgi:chaperonin GroEL (HSP60 family)
MFLPYGLASQEFLINSNDNSLTVENPLILVVDSAITEIFQLINSLEYIKTLDRPLIIFSSEIKKEPLSVLLYNMRKENMTVSLN